MKARTFTPSTSGRWTRRGRRSEGLLEARLLDEGLPLLRGPPPLSPGEGRRMESPRLWKVQLPWRARAQLHAGGDRAWRAGCGDGSTDLRGGPRFTDRGRGHGQPRSPKLERSPFPRLRAGPNNRGRGARDMAGPGKENPSPRGPPSNQGLRNGEEHV